MNLPSFLLEKNNTDLLLLKPRYSLIDKGLKVFSDLRNTLLYSYMESEKNSFIHGLNPVVKLIWFISTLIAVSLIHSVLSELLIFSFVITVALLARINMHIYFKKVIPLVFLFGFVISFFSVFNIISSGMDVLILFNIKSNFMGLDLPPYLSITREGLNIFLILTLRVLNSISASILFFEVVRFDDFIYSLKKIKISDFFLLILNISYIYIFNFSKLIEDFYTARKSRVLNTSLSKERNWVINTVAYLFLKSISYNEKVFDAMISRGLGKKIVLRDRKFPVKQRDIYSLILLIVFLVLMVF